MVTPAPEPRPPEPAVDSFAFHPELLELRGVVLEALAERGFAWLSHFGSVDLLHDRFGLEVCAVHEEDDAREIERLLGTVFPDWRYRHTYYEDQSLREIGWKVIIARDPDGYGQNWQAAGGA